jgi:hypothetical protein
MKIIKYLFFISAVGLTGCNKIIDINPQSNLNTATFYANASDVSAALTGCYNGMQKPLLDEWTLTELRSDNAIQGVPGSLSTPNLLLNELDQFMPSPSHTGVYSFWINTYFNIRNTNMVLNSLGVNYAVASGKITYDQINIPVPDASRKTMAAEASFIRAYHYFNLVRLYGGVFLSHEPTTPAEAKEMNRVSADEIYKLIIADLQNASDNGDKAKFGAIASANIGRANSWAAKALLAKVYLTLNRKAEAATLLTDIITNSAYKLQANYADVFSTANEMNSEVLFAIRYKAGGIGLGSTLGNSFAPLNSGAAVINGSGSGLNYPAMDLNNQYDVLDKRKAVNIGTYGTGAAAKLYPAKHISPVVVANDSETDWMVIRYSDVLLMLAEANGYTQASLDLINQTRVRAGLPLLTMTTVSTLAAFETSLSDERKLEFAFENQRWFDLLRFSSTLPSIKIMDVLKAHFAVMYPLHYMSYPAPKLSLLDMQNLVTTNKMILPIPQREIDNNTGLVIQQNPGY